MRIGLSGGSSTVDRAVEQAREAEQKGFSSLWFAGATGGDPLVQMAFAGRATQSIELGTSVLQTYPCHPQLQANRVKAVSAAIGRPVTLGIGPSHQQVVERMGYRYEHIARHIEDYVTALSELLGGEIPVLVAALGPRLLQVAGRLAQGTILWLANARAVESHVVPRITEAAAAAGRPGPRIVAGLPVAVHDDVDEARAAALEQFGGYGNLPNYQRILAHGGIESPAEAAIVGDESSVADQVMGLFAAGATDVWAAPFPVGQDRTSSRARTRALLADLAQR
jgi:alkanesulfonate monooxygenase SsuD/methylene tetrahydromethanopterin reductase-like flavin-dependent oxidoreductase (luciferase family)